MFYWKQTFKDRKQDERMPQDKRKKNKKYKKKKKKQKNNTTQEKKFTVIRHFYDKF